MRVAIYAGTFDPMTLGHVSVVERASLLFDKVIVVVAVNPGKVPLFSLAERLAMMVECLARFANVECISTEGLVIDLAREAGARFLVRGVRSVTDADSEIALANMNHALAPDIATVFVPAQPDLSEVSSSRLKELAREGADIAQYCPDNVARRLRERLGCPRTDAEGCHVTI